MCLHAPFLVAVLSASPGMKFAYDDFDVTVYLILPVTSRLQRLILMFARISAGNVVQNPYMFTRLFSLLL